MSETYMPPREPRDRTRTHTAKLRTLQRRAMRAAKYGRVSL